MGTKSRETLYGSSIRASAERAAEARKETADKEHTRANRSDHFANRLRNDSIAL
jgi:hypothetical protein